MNVRHALCQLTHVFSPNYNTVQTCFSCVWLRHGLTLLKLTSNSPCSQECLELLILLPPSLQCWDYRHATSCPVDLWGTRDQTQSFQSERLAFYQLSLAPNLNFNSYLRFKLMPQSLSFLSRLGQVSNSYLWGISSFAQSFPSGWDGFKRRRVIFPLMYHFLDCSCSVPSSFTLSPTFTLRHGCHPFWIQQEG